MKARRLWALAVAGALSGLAMAQSAPKQFGEGASATEKFVGAWRMAWMEEPGPDGTVTRITDRNGTLMYTRDGRMSVQIQFPESQSLVSNAARPPTADPHDHLLGDAGTRQVPRRSAAEVVRDAEGLLLDELAPLDHLPLRVHLARLADLAAQAGFDTQ